MAFLLALPIPPIVPLTNTLPAICILVTALAMMEEDGLLIWLGYAMGALTVFYFVLTASLIISAMTKLFHAWFS